MPVHCAKCGEELLGAVNRCWRCGTALVPQSGPSGIPPVRRAPVETPLDAAVIDDKAPVATDGPNADEANDGKAHVDAVSSGANAEPAVATKEAESKQPREHNAPQRGTAQTTAPKVGATKADEPNATSPTKTDARVDPAHTATPKPAPTTGTVTTGTPNSRSPASSVSYRGRTAALGGAIGAVALGALGIVSAVLFPIGGVLTAMLGLAMGIWGLFSQRRLLAFAGILLCCLALATGAILGGIQLYDAAIGHKPWEEAPEPDVWDDGF